MPCVTQIPQHFTVHTPECVLHIPKACAKKIDATLLFPPEERRGRELAREGEFLHCVKVLRKTLKNSIRVIA